MIVSPHPRRGRPYSANSLFPHLKSHRIISFADPHPLTLLESYRFKNIAGALLPSRAPRFAGEGASSNPSNIPACQRLLAYLFYFHTLAHSFARFCTHQKLNPFLFKRFRTLCEKAPGVGVPLRFSTRIKMNPAGTNSSLIGETLRRLHRHSTRGGVSLRLRFASPPPRFLVNYIDPILHRVGPAGHFLHSTQRPRS